MRIMKRAPFQELAVDPSSAFRFTLRGRMIISQGLMALRSVRTDVTSPPEQGVLDFDYTTFQSNDDPALKLSIYAPVAR